VTLGLVPVMYELLFGLRKPGWLGQPGLAGARAAG